MLRTPVRVQPPLEDRHRHCLECISRECDVLECSMVNCMHECGVIAHQCKMLDHEEVCVNKMVSCINAAYGCEAVMPRKEIREHLAHCPASHCKTRELQEAPLEECVHGCGLLIHQYDTLDHEELCSNQIVPCTNATFGCKAKMPRHEINAHLLHCPASVVVCKFSLEYDTKFAAPSLQFYMPTESAYQEQLDVLRGCYEIVRRDKFDDHHIMQHDIIHSRLYDWLVHHCPMMIDYGCDFKIQRLVPPSEYFTLVYNNCSMVFTVALKEQYAAPELGGLESVKGWYMTKLQQQKELAVYGYDDVPTDPLCALPTEVLHLIISYLDSSALFCLSLTNQMLREICLNMKNSSMVVMTWKQHENGWKESNKVWRYSRTARLSRQWHFTNNDSAMNNHLQQCPYKVPPYDATKLWHCVPCGGSSDGTLWQQVPSSSVDLNKL